MTMANEVQQKIDNYLSRLRAALPGLPEDEARDIVEELRSHITEKTSSSISAGGTVSLAAVDATLAALGSPEELGRQYRTDALLGRTEGSRSPFRILRGLFQWAGLSFAGFFVLLGSIFGYFFGAVFTLVALMKPIHPQSAGLWMIPRGSDFEISFRLGFGSVPPGGKDLLGWWTIPVGLLAGGTLTLLTTAVALWLIRQYRKRLMLPKGAA